MPCIGFKDRFASKILTGEKTQTVRTRADIAPGQSLTLLTGIRTAACKRLAVVECAAVTPITITAIGAIVLGCKQLTNPQAEAFARADGFASHREMMEFFRGMHRMPFNGYVIEWTQPNS